ncbi:PREDICTED: protein NRT1/ PTR FAMILY 4.1-like isoform X2 [Tarenaya hassleriana]|nr:PREDICTED: protein NRT1/ PTR FAMILY 4.1-like isoform X2 [Tarenaya hassleriana]
MESEIEEEGFEDWRGRRAIPGKHGGIRAAAIICVVEMLENMVFITNANTLVSYFIKTMHYSAAKSATMMTNFLGTSFLLSLFGGFIADSFLTRFASFIIFCLIEIMGLILLTIQAQVTKLQPPPSETPSPRQEAVLFVGLYALGLGISGVKPALPAHGGDQLDSRNKSLISAFFNWYFFSICIGGLVAVSVMVWIEENVGISWSFKISVVVLALALSVFVGGFPFYRYKRPGGSPLMRILKVIVSASRNRKGSLLDAGLKQNLNPENKSIHHNKFKCLDKALLDDEISATEVEETRTFLSLLPIFASTIMMNCCLAQILTFSVQQGAVMNRKLSPSFEIPVPSLTVIPVVFSLFSIPLYEFFHRRISGQNPAMDLFQPLKRIGLGLFLASISMAVAAFVEAKRRFEAVNHNVSISVFYLAVQYLLLGVSDMCTLGGMLEFFYREAPERMRSISSSLSWCSNAMGFFLSTILVELTNSITGAWFDGGAWLGGRDLNKARLDLFYAVLSVLNTLNLFNYIYWAKRY